MHYLTRKKVMRVAAGALAAVLALPLGVSGLSVQAAEPAAKSYTLTLTDQGEGNTVFADTGKSGSMKVEVGELVVLETKADDGNYWMQTEMSDEKGKQAVPQDQRGTAYDFSGGNVYLVMPEKDVTVTTKYGAWDSSQMKKADFGLEFDFADDSEEVHTLDPDAGIAPMSAVGKNKATVKRKKNLHYGHVNTADYVVTASGGKEYHGFCAQPSKDNPADGTKKTVAILRSTKSTNNVHTNGDRIDSIKRLAVLGTKTIAGEANPAYDPDIFNPLDGISTTETEAYEAVVGAHICIGILYNAAMGYSTSPDYHGLSDAWVEKARGVIDAANAYDFTAKGISLDGYTLYTAKDGDAQDILWVEREKYGTGKLKKVSSNPALTDNHKLYSIVNAQYGVYADSACTDLLGVVKSVDGEESELDLAPGTYYVKETVPPEGMFLCDTVYTVKVEADKTTEFKVVDDPAIHDPDISIMKKDKDTGKPTPQGNGTFEGAEFTIRYYAEKSQADIAGKQPTKTWVVKSDKNGYVNFRDCEVTGDAMYTTTSGVRYFPLGVYVFEETKAPHGYLLPESLNNAVQVLVRDSDTLKRVTGLLEATEAIEPVGRGGFIFQKRDIETGKETPQGDARMGVGRYQVINQSKNSVVVNKKEYAPGEVCFTFETDENGAYTSPTDLLPIGSYRLEETDAPTGYLVEGEVQVDFDIAVGEITDLTKEMKTVKNQVIRGGVQVEKRDLEYDKSEAMGGKDHGKNEFGTHLDGIKFTIKNVSEREVKVDGVLYQPGDDVCEITTHWNEEKKAYTAETAEDALPYGTYEIRESATTDSYLLSDPESRTFEIRENHKMVTNASTGEKLALIWKDQVVRGEFSFVKIVDRTSERLSAPFAITNLTTNETHIIVTDKNGMWSSEPSWYSHKEKTNANDKFVGKGMTKDDAISMKDLETAHGVWFSLGEDGSTSEATDDLGALPYGKYSIQELYCENNLNYDMQQFTFDIYRHGYTVDGSTLTNDREQPPVLKTTAMVGDTELNMVKAGEKVVLKDKVVYDHVKPGREYTLKASLMVKTMGEDGKVTAIPLKDAKDVAYTAEKTFTPEQGAGFELMEIEVDTKELAGSDLVFFEKLYVKEKEVGSHEDPEDEGQTIHVPEVKTSLADPDTDAKLIEASDTAVVVDTVQYKGLKPGEQYTLTGTLYRKSDGKPLTDADGKPITVTEKFRAGMSEGQVEVKFAFDAKLLAGETIVAGETLSYKGEEIAVHFDLEDEAQSVRILDLGTKAWDNGTMSKILTLSEQAQVTDRVYYTGLNDGEEYELFTVAMDKATGLPVLDQDGKEYSAVMKFTAKGEKALAGLEDKQDQTDVEEKTEDKKQDASDEKNTDTKNPEQNEKPDTDKDKDQEIVDQDGGTPEWSDQIDFDSDEAKVQPLADVSGDASDKENADQKDMAADEKAESDKKSEDQKDADQKSEDKKDTDQKDSETDKKAEDQTEVQKPESDESVDTKKETSVPDAGSIAAPAGKEGWNFVDVSMTINTKDFEGKDIVFFEYLRKPGEGPSKYAEVEKSKTTIAKHADLNDADQTLVKPEIATVAKAEDGSKTVKAKDSVKAVDTVTYTGLEGGREYQMKATVIRKKDKQPISGAENTLRFIADASGKGSVEVPVTVNAKGLVGEEIVFFEDCSDQATGSLVAQHADLDDVNQILTVDGASVGKKDSLGKGLAPKTGLQNPAVWFLLAAAAFFGVGIYVYKFRKKK